MPPVRWKILYIILLSHQIYTEISAEGTLQDPAGMISDGWRPIFGNRRPAGSVATAPKPQKGPKVIDVEIVKSQGGVVTSTSTRRPEMSAVAGHSTPEGNKPAKLATVKYQTLPPNAVTIGRPSEFGFRKLPLKPLGYPMKRKPLRQIAAHSTRSEVYLHPGSLVSFPVVKQNPSPVRTREAQGLGLFGSQGHFTVNQPNAHVEINRFPVLPDNFPAFEQYKSPGLTYIVPKLKKQPDEYSRNLVPPPPARHLAEKEKLKLASSKIPEKFKEDRFGAKTPQPAENAVAFVPQKRYEPKPPAAVDVQVTKENLKAYHNLFKPDYYDYEYRLGPKLQTYEVTEGKWFDNPNPYTFNYLKPKQQVQQFQQAQQIQQVQQVHQVQQQTVSQITNEPIVELNVPPFLPTPVKPDPAYPTSPTQSEASTVFNQISQKMNKYKTAALANNPLFFDIKEVSTHYPILGRPEFVYETQTPNPAKDNEIPDEVSTAQPEEVTTKKRRRRPQPRRPTSTSTTSTTTSTVSTTTTEDPQTTEAYRFQKIQEELGFETDKPPKRHRQRPNRYRYPNSNSQENPARYSTTTQAAEEEDKSRGRNRYRQRGKDPTESRIKEQAYRKRIRTTTMPTNHKYQEDSDFESKYYQTVETTTKPQRLMEYDDGTNEDYETTPLNDVRTRFYATKSSEETTTLSNINEIDTTTAFTSKREEPEQPEQPEEPEESTLATTAAPKPTTTKPTKTRTRPTLFKARPRFSVKDYRQRLTHLSTSTPSSTTPDSSARTTLESSRFKFPARLRTRPTMSSTVAPRAEETTTELVVRRKFKPKDPRRSTTTTEASTIAEANVKAVNTRLRPFRTTTESSISKAKVSIKPSLYSNRRRTVFNTKSKLNNRTDPIASKPSDDDDDDDEGLEETTSVYQSSRITTESPRVTTESLVVTTEPPGATTLDANISDDDYSKRISDLTSSFKMEYDTPGLFKSVAPISRRVPSYFTISTEDPILPIEAFFPKLKDKGSD